MFDNGREITYIEAYDGNKCLGKFVNMQTLNTFLKEHKTHDVHIKFETLKTGKKLSLFYDLVRKYHIR